MKLAAKTLILPLLFSILLSSQSCSTSEFDYLQQSRPHEVPIPFAENIFKEYNTGVCSFSKDGKYCFFNHRTGKDKFDIMYFTKNKNNSWSSPQLYKHSNGYKDMEPISTSDSTFIFASNRAFDIPQMKGLTLLYEVKKTGNIWNSPELLIPKKTAEQYMPMYYATMSTQGDIVFRGRGKKGDIYLTNHSNLSHITNLPFNSSHNDSHPCIATDGQFILFDSDRSGNNSSIYISFKNNNSWSDPLLLPEIINNDDTNIQPMLSPDNRYLFFLRIHKKSKPIIYWVKIDTMIESLRSKIK